MIQIKVAGGILPQSIPITREVHFLKNRNPPFHIRKSENHLGNQHHLSSNTIGWSVSASSSVHLILTGTLSLLSSVKEPKNRRKGRIASASSSEQRISTSPSSQYHN
ncbi:unnamed protein product [Orchesella dallaii]|uniref:Uncharacterized protein n=1 Tax=Orchesella dallaii TaxID=48710 RepID=A0ABP1RT86_9HEXA